MGVHHVAGIQDLADDVLTGVLDTTVAYLGMSLLSLIVPQRERASKLPNITKTFTFVLFLSDS